MILVSWEILYRLIINGERNSSRIHIINPTDREQMIIFLLHLWAFSLSPSPIMLPRMTPDPFANPIPATKNRSCMDMSMLTAAKVDVPREE